MKSCSALVNNLQIGNDDVISAFLTKAQAALRLHAAKPRSTQGKLVKR
jgi:hypothetical protein